MGVVLAMLLLASPALADVPPDDAPDAIEAATPEELLELGRRRIDGGDFTGARIVIDQALERVGGDDDAAVYLKGLAWELDGDPAQAIALYDEGLHQWPASGFTDDRIYRKAEALAAMDQYDEALRVLHDVPTDGLGERDLRKLAVVEATWILGAGRERKGLRTLSAALDALPAGEATWHHARARAAIARVYARRASDLDLDRGERRIKRRLDARAELLAAIERQVTAIAELEEPEWVLAGLLTLGGAYERVADDLLASRRPRRLTPMQVEIYDAELERRAHTVYVKASRHYGIGLDMVGRLQWSSPRAAQLESALADVTDTIEGIADEGR